MSFHGRDLFAPVAAMLSANRPPESSPWALIDTNSWPSELAEVIYIDHYGNAMTGIRATTLATSAVVRVRDRRLAARQTFSAAPPGEPFWYSNSIGLVEIAVREDSAAALLELAVGVPVTTTDYESLLAPNQSDQ